jgi:HK97 family phage portal protein
MLSTLARPTPHSQVSWSPFDPRWYAAIGGMSSDAGIPISSDSALKIAVVFRAVNVLAHSIASIPLVINRLLDDRGNKERARNHPAYDLLHDKPNAWMTSFRWRHLLAVQAILDGNHYSEILPGPGGIGQLVPLPPSTTRVADQLADGRLVYVTKSQTVNGWGPERRLLQDEVLHVRGFSMNGKSGIPLTNLARNAMGLALAAEKHGSMFMKKGARLSGVLTTKATLSKEQREINESAWQKAWGGPEGSGGTPILSGDLAYTTVSANNKDSQWLESRTFQVEELLRFLGVPGVLCGYADKTATYASAEQFFLSFVTHSVLPWTTNIAQELNASVVTGGSDYYADFILEGLLKGDIKTRYEAHQIGISAGFESRNEARVIEGWNRGPDDLDEFLQPQQAVPAGTQPDAAIPPAPKAPPPADDPTPDDGSNARLQVMVRRAAERVVRKEIAAMVGNGKQLGAARRYASNPEGWQTWLARFYSEHAATVATELSITLQDARTYCLAQQKRLEAQGAGAIEQLEAHTVPLLQALVLGAGEPVVATALPSGPVPVATPAGPIVLQMPARERGRKIRVERDTQGRALYFEEVVE